jgi:hypothetical protein
MVVVVGAVENVENFQKVSHYNCSQLFCLWKNLWISRLVFHRVFIPSQGFPQIDKSYPQFTQSYPQIEVGFPQVFHRVASA